MSGAVPIHSHDDLLLSVIANSSFSDELMSPFYWF